MDWLGEDWLGEDWKGTRAEQNPTPAEIRLLRAGISRDQRHKRRPTGGKRPQVLKKRKSELGRQV